MEYITHTRFKGKAICGEVNIPACSICNEINGVIYYNNNPICIIKSQNCINHFARNDDNMGMKRGKLTQAIQKLLSKRDSNYQNRWDKIWKDDICQSYKRKEYQDYWLWNTNFYNADINTLKYIANLIGLNISK